MSFTLLHDALVVPPEGPTRAPLSRDIERRAGPLFPQPFATPNDTGRAGRHGRWAKWWTVEIRFDRPLTRAEVRQITRSFEGYRNGDAGVDGAFWRQWWNSYPGTDDEGYVRAAMRRVGVPGCMRAAPYGRDCAGAPTCAAVDYPGCPVATCEIGRPESCDPVFTDADWIAVDPWKV